MFRYFAFVAIKYFVYVGYTLNLLYILKVISGLPLSPTILLSIIAGAVLSVVGCFSLVRSIETFLHNKGLLPVSDLEE